MTDITLERLHEDIVGLRQDIVRLEAKVDSKPSLMAMFTAVIVAVFGMFGVIASTVTMLVVVARNNWRLMP